MVGDYDPGMDNILDRPSAVTPDRLLETLGEHGLADLLVDIRGNIRYAEDEVSRLDIQLASAKAALQSLRADQDTVVQAQRLGRDKGLE